MELDHVPQSTFLSPVYGDDNTPFITEQEMRANVDLIDADIERLKSLLSFRLQNTSDPTDADKEYFPSRWPVGPTSLPYGALTQNLKGEERLLLLLSLLPHYAPEALNAMVASVQKGVIIEHPHLRGNVNHVSLDYIPTLQTILFLMSGTDKSEQQSSYRRLMFDGTLLKQQVVSLQPFLPNEPVRSDRELIPEIAGEYVQYLLHGRIPRPDFGKNFPAKLLTTNKNWDQLILNQHTTRQVELLIDWIEYGTAFTQESVGYFGPGYPALFFGPPGTGKSMTAALIGKRCGVHVYRVDASRIVSKYIGETEKNIVQLFNRMKMENQRHEKKAVLFFDEADVLFSKRTEVKDAKDKWANMETSVLLPLVEEYDGLVIVATNLERNLDDAMDRRFQLKIKFPFPKYEDRLLVWKNALPPSYQYPNSKAAEKLAQYHLSPAAIINVLKGCCLQARKNGTQVLVTKDLDYYIKTEFAKSGLTPHWDNLPSK